MLTLAIIFQARFVRGGGSNFPKILTSEKKKKGGGEKMEGFGHSL